jgi:hypothetical protein
MNRNPTLNRRFASALLVSTLASAAWAQSAANQAGIPAALEDALVRAFEAPLEVVQADGALEASNSRAGIATRFTAQGVRFGALDGAGWSQTMRLVGAGRRGAGSHLPEVEPTALGRRVEYRRGDLVEWYVNDARGLEQGFTLERAPEGGDSGRPLELELALHGDLSAEPTNDGRGCIFYDASGSRALDYLGLVAWDVTGRELPARLLVEARRLVIVVDDRGAVYPLTIDPVISVQEAKLLASDGLAGDRFGLRVALNGDTALVGAPTRDEVGVDSGVAYVFVRSGTQWAEQAKLIPSGSAAGDRFGDYVTLEGDTAVIAAQFDDFALQDAGAAYVFVRSGTLWTETAKLTASDPGVLDRFSNCLSLSGNTLLVGAPFDDDNGSESGSAYVFVGSGSTWIEAAKLTAPDGAASDLFGNSVSLSGDTALVGANFDDDNGVDSGSAHVFVRSGTVWTHQAKLLASDGAATDEFGIACAVRGDVALIGSIHDDDNGHDSGSAYAFIRSGTTWTQADKLTPGDGKINDLFGASISISGPWVAIGALMGDGIGKDTGSAYAFLRTGGVWTEQLELTAGDGAAGDLFGFSLSMDGDTVFVGARHNDQNGMDSGASYAFVLMTQAPSTYCSSKTTGFCAGAQVIGWTGAPSTSAGSGFVITGDPARGGRLGLLLHNRGSAPAGSYASFGGLGNGLLCVNPVGVRRSIGLLSGGTPGLCGGGAQFALDMNAFASGALGGHPEGYLSEPGTTVHVQWWGRDFTGSNFLSNGMEYTVGF